MSTFDEKKYDDRNLQHAINPEIGDYWHEMFCPVAVVIDVTPFSVTVCEKTKSVDDDHWTWDIEQIELYTRKQFTNRFRYGRVGNHDFEATDDMTNIKNKFWCDVSGKKQEWVRDFLNETERG